MGRGGKRIRVNAYQHINSSDIVLGVDSLDKELSNCNNLGVKVWVPIYRGQAKRPSQAFEDLVRSSCEQNLFTKESAQGVLFALFDANVVCDKDLLVWSVKYWANDMNLNKSKRVGLVKSVEIDDRKSLNKVTTQ